MPATPTGDRGVGQPASSVQRAPSLSPLQAPVASLCTELPAYVRNPPIETVTFGWGVNEDGQLGLDTDQDTFSPKVVEALLGTRLRGRELIRTPLAAGSRMTLAIEANGQLLSWGWNARASLGLGHCMAGQRKPKRVSALAGERIVQVAIGGWHCLAVNDEGQAYAWGGNEYGQCGIEEAGRDIETPTPCVPNLRVTQVSSGGMHSCVLTEDGKVWMWGEPWGEFKVKVDRHPRPVKGAVDIVKIQCGAFHSLALTRQGEVLSWGINDYGQLGNGTTTYVTTPERVMGLEDVVIADIAAGGWHSLALSDTGEVWTWGRGEYGRLGIGDRHGESKLKATRVQGRLAGQRVVQATCGGSHTAVLTEHGRIYTWGRASFGRLGVGNTSRDAVSPVEILLPGGQDRWRVIAVAAGGRHTLALAVPDNSSGADGRDPSSTPARSRSGVVGDSGPSSLGASPLDSDDPESLENDYDDDVELEAAAAASGTGIRDLVALVDAEEAAEDAVQLESNHVAPGELPASVHSQELLSRTHASRASSPRLSPRSHSASPSHHGFLGPARPPSPGRSVLSQSPRQSGGLMSQSPRTSGGIMGLNFPAGSLPSAAAAQVDGGSPEGSESSGVLGQDLNSALAARGLR
ncbi:hypothetical protein WJX73_009758 [Symbiochloris irregularis]|uniref:RCC1-like domain-containing protein n=1 Tax=Symbiochloris irregularis TaxID=706552 RepID=A0AAW1PNL9_9CHLO